MSEPNNSDSPAKRKRGRPKKRTGVLVSVDMGNGTWIFFFVDASGEIICLPDPHGLDATPAYIAFENGDPLKAIFGHVAQRYTQLHPEWTCGMAKRARGKDFVAIIDKDGAEWMASQLESMFLKWRLSPLESRYGEQVAAVIATVPANFDDSQRRGTQAVVEQAGFKLLKLINEPTAAAVAAVQGKDGIWLIFDLGHGTLDVSIVRVSGGHVFEVLATAGKSDLGGAELTAAIVEHCLGTLESRGIQLDPVNDAQALALLNQDCETVKCDLSTMERATVIVRAGSTIVDIEITRELAESLWQGILVQCRQLLTEALDSAGLSPGQVDGVVPAGGPSRMPCVQAMLAGAFSATKLVQVPDPQKVIALGAAMLGEATVEERIAAGDTSFEGMVTAQMLEGKIELREITGQCLGVRVLNSAGEIILGEIVPQGSPVPGKYAKTFGLTGGDQGANTTVTILEGKANAPADEATVLTEYPMDNLPPGPTKSRIEVIFTISSDGRVDVTARDTYSDLEITGQFDVKGKLIAAS